MGFKAIKNNVQLPSKELYVAEAKTINLTSKLKWRE